MKTKTPFESRLLAYAEPVAGDLGLAVVRVRVLGGNRRKRVQIMAERPDGSLSVDECAALSRALSAVFDVEDPFEGAWDLEVSSPGIDRPLTEPEHFTRRAGYEVKLELARLLEGRKRFKGSLVGEEDGNVLINMPEEPDATIALPFAWLADAKLVLSDELIKDDLKRRGGPAPAPAEDTEHEPASQESDP